MSTIVIDNWTGALTRNSFGNINSGLAKFDTSWGYNPFFNTGQLTWFKAPGDLTSGLSGDLLLAAQSKIVSGQQETYAISNTGNLWKITGEGGGTALVAALSSGSPTFLYGASLKIFNGKIWIGHDKGVTKIAFDGSGETQVGTWASDFVQNTYRPLTPFIGSLFVGNTTDATNTNIGKIDNTEALTVSVLTGALGKNGDVYVRDLDVTPDLTYLVISTSNVNTENMTPVNDTNNGASGNSNKYYYNGTDISWTNGISLPGFGITALNTFGPFEYSMMYDTFGTALYQGGKKIWTLRNMKSPFPNAIESTGNFLTWTAMEMVWNLDTQAGRLNGGLYYYGQLDENTPVGLWRLNRWTSANAAGQIYQAPFNHFTTNRYVSTDNGVPPQAKVDSNGTHIYSYVDYTSSGAANKFYYFYAAPPDDSPAGWSGAVAGVYETQTQMFSKKIVIKQARVYTNPTGSGDSFQIDFIGPDGTIITNGTSTYLYAAGTDVTKLQGPQDRINFNPTQTPTYGIGIRLTNVGSTNMVINKVELDWEESGQ